MNTTIFASLKNLKQFYLIINIISGQWLVHWTSDQEFRVPELVGSFFFTLSTQEYKWVCVSCQGNLTKCQGGSNLE